MDRRKFIKNTASFITLPILLNGQAIHAWSANGVISPEQTNGKVLVLIQLDGGNDGLNTLIPLDIYDKLANLRPEVILPENKILSLSDLQGIHPSMPGIKNLFDAEKLMMIQNVGYPKANLSHFRSKEIMLSASDSKTVVSSGWFGRYVEMLHPSYPEDYPSISNPDPLAITIGSSSSPSCQGNLSNMGLVLKNLNTNYESQTEQEDFPETPYGVELKYVTQVMKNTEKYLEVISETAKLSESISEEWPSNNSLADKLKIVARLIAGGLKTPVYIVNMGGFDTHANQVTEGETESGKHAGLLKKVSEAVSAFQDELKLQSKEDDVIGLVYSEFGRRIKSNKSNGTDHGAAFPMMLFGSRVNPMVLGENPVIPENISGKTNVAMKIDFRSVYSSILYHWFEIGKNDISSILFNEFDILPILKSTVGLDSEKYDSKQFSIKQVYPNPVSGSAKIQFETCGGHNNLSIYSSDGRKLKVIVDKNLYPGNHTVSFSRNGLASGHYILVLQNNSQRVSHPISIQ